MGLAEGLAYLVVIVTVCQYFINWAAYLEKKFTISENVSAAVKKKQKKLRKQGKNEDDVAQEIIDEEVNLLGPKPTCFDTLPFQFYRALKYYLLAIPGIFCHIAINSNSFMRFSYLEKINFEARVEIGNLSSIASRASFATVDQKFFLGCSKFHPAELKV